MSAFLFAIVIRNQAGPVSIDCARAVAREMLDVDDRGGGKDFGGVRLGEPGVFEGIVMAVVVELLSYPAWIWLYHLTHTSGIHHLSPNLSPRPTLSVVGTCCRANGLKGAIALLNAAELSKIY